MLKSIWSVVLALGTVFLAFSQKVNISLMEKDRSPVVGAAVNLKLRSDTLQVKNLISNTEGKASFDATAKTQYLLRVTMPGFQTLEKGVTTPASGDMNLDYTLEEAETALGAVTVTARRPLMRQEEDKTIVDPEPIAESSANAYEIVEKTPGLFVDQDGNIYLSSATPATVHINGREQRMSASDIAGILKSLPPGSIERLEILRTPSAKYDAANSGGIVNVVLKKGVKIGRTGSAYAGFQQGFYGNQFAGFSLNNSDGGRTSNFNLNFGRRESFEKLVTTRLLDAERQLEQDAFTVTPGRSINTGLTLGFEPNRRWEISLETRANYNFTGGVTDNNSVIESSSQGELSRVFNHLENDNHSFYVSPGFRAKYKIDSAGSELVFDASYTYLNFNGAQVFDINTLPSTAIVGGEGDIGNVRHFATIQTDWRRRYARQLVVEAGIKTAFQVFDNGAVYQTIVNGVRSEDPFRTNTYRYDDQISAAYIQGSKTWGEWVLKTGLRAENTRMNGRQTIPADTTFTVGRTDLFPYVYLSRSIAKIAGYPLRAFAIYRRSINRPGYDMLNPYPRFLDAFLYESGNPALQPQFTQNVEFNISFQDMPILAFGRNYIEDIFTQVMYQDPQIQEITYRTYDNVGKNEETYFRITAAIPPGGKYFIVGGAQYNLNRYDGLYENAPLTFERGSWRFFTYQHLQIDPRSRIMLHGFWMTKGQMQFYELKDFGNLNISVNRQFLDRKLMVTISMSDVLFTHQNDFTLQQGNINATGKRSWDSRRYGLNMRYNFGLRRKEEREAVPFGGEGMGG